MKDKLATYDTLFLAKSKGYDLTDCVDYGVVPLHNWSKREEYLKKEESWYFNVTLSQIQTWLRDVHNCLVIVDYHSEVDNDEMYLKTKSDIKYGVVINYYGTNFEIEQGDDNDYLKHSFDSYEDALEDGLYKALMMLPNENN